MLHRHIVLSSLLLAAVASSAACSSDDDGMSMSTDPDPGKGKGEIDPATLKTNPGSTVTCATVNENVVKFDTTSKVKPGWGGLPEAFQIVPPGGELCGSVHFGDAKEGMPMVASDLFGQAMVDFYQKAATASGCTLKLAFQDAKPFNWRTQVTATCADKKILISTDTGYDFYSIYAL